MRRFFSISRWVNPKCPVWFSFGREGEFCSCCCCGRAPCWLYQAHRVLPLTRYGRADAKILISDAAAPDVISGGGALTTTHRAYTKPTLAFTRYCFTSKLYCRSQSSFCCPPPHLQSRPYCDIIARPLRNIRPPLRPPFSKPYTIQCRS